MYKVRVEWEGETLDKGRDDDEFMLDCIDFSWKLRTVECCGWIEISNWPAKTTPKRLEYLDKLCNLEIEFRGDWAHTYNNPKKFTLFCVLIGYQMCWETRLLARGWVKLPPFYNPNTGNECTPFMRPVQKEEEVQ